MRHGNERIINLFKEAFMNLLTKTIIFIAMISCFGCVTVIEETGPETSGKVAICHKGKTIYVDEAAVKAHLGHGDYMGTCQ
jgi:hypothetical protein